MKRQFSEEQLKEIDEIAELIELYKQEGLNRLKIWQEFRSSGTQGYILLEAFRKTGLFTG